MAKKEIKLLSFLIGVILISIIGISYAYFSVTVTGNDTATSIITKTGSLSLLYNSGNEINASNIVPGWSESKTFSVTNTGNVKVDYSINWSELLNTFVGSDLVYTITGSNGVEVNETVMPIKSTEIKNLIEIEPGITDTYTLTIKYKNTSNDQNADQGKIFSAKITISELKNLPVLRVKELNIAETSKFLGGPVTRQEVESIEFLDNKNIPADAIGSWDVSKDNNQSIMAWYKAGDTEGLYKIYIGADNIILANPDSSNLFSYMFNLNKIEFNNNFNTSKVTNMSWMFFQTGYNNPNFTLDVSNFDTSKVTSMWMMFYMAGSSSTIFTLDVSNFNTSNVTTMYAMFSQTGYRNPNFTLDVSNFDTRNVTNMYAMFSQTGFMNRNFILDVSNFDTSKVTDMSKMFYMTGCNNFNFKLNIKSFNFPLVTNKSDMFFNIQSRSTIYVKDATAATFISSGTSLTSGVTIVNCSTNTCP